MKKLSLLVALALIVSFGAFAQVSLDYAVTGSATMEWGIELNAPMYHGFKNSTDSTMDLTIGLDPSSLKKDGEGIYGEISLTGFGVRIGEGQGVKWRDAIQEVAKSGEHFNANDPANDDYLKRLHRLNPEFQDNRDDTNADGYTDLYNDMPWWDESGIFQTSGDGKFAEAEESYDYTFIETGVTVLNPNVAAKIVISDALFVQIASKPTFLYNNASEVVDGDTWLGAAGLFEWPVMSISPQTSTESSGGMTVGFSSDVVYGNVKLMSFKDYDENYSWDYAVGGEVSIDPSDLFTLTVNAAYNPNYWDSDRGNGKGYWEVYYSGAPLFFGGKLVLKPAEMLDVTIGADVSLDPEADEIKPNMDFNMIVPVDLGNGMSLNLAGSYSKLGFRDDGVVDAKLGFALTGDFSFSLDVMAGQLMPLSDGADVAQEDYLAPLPASTSLDIEMVASYKLMLDDANYIKPMVKTGFDMNVIDKNFEYEFNADGKQTDRDEWEGLGMDDDILDLVASVEAALIPNTVFTVAYESGQLMPWSWSANDMKASDAGDIKFTTKISY